MFGKNMTVFNIFLHIKLLIYIYLIIYAFIYLFTHFIYLFCENEKNRIRKNAFSKGSSKRMGARGGAVS